VALVRCPECRSRLDVQGDGEHVGEILQGQLGCANGHSFPVIGGIPRFVGSEQYAENFGFEWNVHRKTQLDTATDRESEESFRLKTGFQPEDLAGKVVLDVGCGMGRFSDVASRWGATVVGVDLSTAVNAAYENLGARENVHIAQADVFHLPFDGPTFDFIFSIGVLHHTPNTKDAFDRLPQLLKPGGKIAIWVYSSYNVATYRASDVLRRVTTRMPKRLLYSLSHVAVPLHHARRVPGLRFVPKMLVPVSGHPIAEWRILDTYDWYSPRYQWKHTYEEVFDWFEDHGLVNLRVLDVPIAMQGQRPEAKQTSTGRGRRRPLIRDAREEAGFPTNQR
jgi:2-polyprenyl-3-methyl-5-hydroxy-6-metoxy-1,4-benzoquinol methylase/uncharacterized protein YbaR (Trm112 family)